MASPVTQDHVLQALSQVKDPELGRDIVSLGMVQDLVVREGAVSFTLVLTTPACPLKDRIEQDIRAALAKIPGIQQINLTWGAMVRPSPTLGSAGLTGIKNVVAVGSGKGGVGKTTVSVNIAVALARDGAKVGLMDADIYGPNVPLMLGVKSLPPFQEHKLVPAQAHGLEIMSMGFLLKDDEPVVWRGPMLHGAIQKFLREVAWGALDYLVVDLPPGTGDVQLSLSQMIPLTGAVVVTTPQDVALLDVKKALAMFQKVKVPILGIVENMSTFVCPHCRTETPIFRHGGGRAAAAQWHLPLLGEIPLVPRVCEAGDAGTPVVAAEPASAVAQAFVQVARQVAARVSVINAQAQPVFIG